MTRKMWTTNDQRAWLMAQSDAFAEAEVNNTRKAFFDSILKGWSEKYPNPDPTPKEIQDAGGKEQAVKYNLKIQEKVNVQPYMTLHVNDLQRLTENQSLVS